jgi:hypothetical protein
MAIKRRAPKRADHPITQEAVEAFRAGDGPALHRALKLKPWQASPIDAAGAAPCCNTATNWPLALRLRAELEAASCQ